METEFNFKSQPCTSREQSEVLLKLGLKKETADMTIHIKDDGGWYVTAEPFYEWEDDRNTFPSLVEPEPIIPAWSLHRLLCLYGADYEIKEVYNNAEECYGMLICAIEKAIEDGYFNEEYLEKQWE